jgi:protoheme IX farnesyltransferase
MTGSIKKYLLVAKPGIIIANAIPVAGGFLLASRGQIDAGALQATLAGTSLVVASGCVFNNYVDRNLDRKMTRTQNRVLAQGLMSPISAVIYATLLGIAGLTLLYTAVHPMCAAVVLAGFSVYVGLYSLCLKRKSAASTLVGSLAGAAPPLAGYCAVTNSFDTGALLLLLIFCLWQIPHAYAIAVLRQEDYIAAAIPLLPVKRGALTAKKHIVGYIMAFLAAALMLTVCGYTGRSFFMVAAATGLSWLLLACWGFRSDSRRWARRLFFFSIVSITVLSVMMAVDYTMPATASLLLTCAP